MGELKKWRDEKWVRIGTDGSKKFKVHNMYSPTGVKKVANTMAQHTSLKKKGYSHSKKK